MHMPMVLFAPREIIVVGCIRVTTGVAPTRRTNLHPESISQSIWQGGV
jgi:hypothetical protein